MLGLAALQTEVLCSSTEQIQKANPGIWSAPERCRKNFAERQTVSSPRLCARGEAETDRGVCRWPGSPGSTPTAHSVRAHETIHKITAYSSTGVSINSKCLHEPISGFYMLCALVKQLQNHLTKRRRSICEQVAEQRTLWKYLCFSLCGMTDIHTQI